MKLQALNRTVAFGLLSTAALAFAQTDEATLARVIEEGKSRNQVMKHLDTLTHRFGPRLTSSSNLKRAQDWAVKTFKSWGLDARLEQWGEVAVGFERGKNYVARMISPWQREFVFTSPAWTPGTKGTVRGPALMEPQTDAEFAAVEGKLKGAWIVMRERAGMRMGAAEPNPLRDKVMAAGIAGTVYGTGDERVHTGGRMTGLEWGKLPTTPRVHLRKSDYDSVALNLKWGREVVLEFNLDQKFTKGPIPQFNVIADLKGPEKPDEMVIVCGHLDSWNGPGSQGANDNGTGSSVTIEAARILSKLGIKPKRSIRFILWSGEEQGLLGSRAYVEAHKSELDKISAVFNDDGGTNYQGGYVCIDKMADMLQKAMAPSQKAFPELPMELSISKDMPQGGGSDHAPFNWQGVPAFFTIEKGRADYGYVWHTQNDRYENAIPEYLVQSSTNAATVALNIANADTMLPRGPKPEPRPESGGRPGGRPPAVGGTKVFFDPRGHKAEDHDGHDHEDEFLDFIADWARSWFQKLKIGH